MCLNNPVLVPVPLTVPLLSSVVSSLSFVVEVSLVVLVVSSLSFVVEVPLLSPINKL